MFLHFHINRQIYLRYRIIIQSLNHPDTSITKVLDTPLTTRAKGSSIDFGSSQRLLIGYFKIKEGRTGGERFQHQSFTRARDEIKCCWGKPF